MASCVSATSQPLPPHLIRPFPLALSGPLHMLSLLPETLLELPDWPNSCLCFKTMLRFRTTQSSRPGHGVGPATAAVLRCQCQGCKRNRCEIWFLATARNDSQGVEGQEGLGVTLRKKPESHTNVPGTWTGRPGPDMPLSLGMGPGGSSPTPWGDIMEAQTPESGVRTTGQILTLVSAPMD